MFKSFTHGERTVNVIISKGEDCGVIKKAIGELQDFAVNNARQISKIGITAGLGFIFCSAAILIQNEQLKELDERVSKLESKQAAEENQEN